MDKKLDAIYSKTLVHIIEELNRLKIQKEDVVNIFQNQESLYVAIYYN